MSKVIQEIKGDAPRSPYTQIPGWETPVEQGVLIMAACAVHGETKGKKFRSPTIVEIGSENGMSASIFATFAPSAAIYCIEVNEQANFMHNLQVLGLDKNIVPVYGDSKKINWQHGQIIDLLFIDGDHSFDGALADLRNFAPFVSQSGWLLLHDCACATNRQPHEQHYTVSAALNNFMAEQGHALGFRHMFSVDSMMCYRRF